MYTAKQIIYCMSLIKNIKLDNDGCLEAWINNDSYSSSINSYEPGSFTRELLELIEKHLEKE